MTNEQTIGSDSDRITQKSSCTYRTSRGVCYIKYDTEDTVCMIRAEKKGRITVIRKNVTEMTFEAGKSSEILYHTPYGTIKAEAYTTKCECEINDDSCRLYLCYSLDINGDKLYNKMEIKVEG